MRKLVFTLLFVAGDSLAHPGHNASSFHAHDWDFALVAFGIGVIAAAVAVWRAK